ncbi:MAG: serine/threonine protein kinase [Planctomycetes bacterium]|nr:serine/threonine protein kinase [Planctomycetota bacterium]
MRGEILEARYLIEDTLDTGGMGVVYRAHDLRLDREVAVKMARVDRSADLGATQLASLHDALAAEAKVVGALEHPSIVPVYALGTTPDGQVFTVMKLVHGKTLAALIDRDLRAPHRAPGELGGERGIAILERIAEALAFAHSQGHVHADLKPDNVMIGGFGEVQVMDWGLAALRVAADGGEPGQRARPDHTWSHTTRGAVCGTPSYMAPEQLRGLPEVDVATDLFGLGALGYHLATGSPPYWGADLDEVLRRARDGQLNDPAARHTPWRPDPDLLAICRKAMAHRKSDRYPDAQALLRDLEALRTSRPLTARRDGPWRWSRRLVKRHPTAAAASLGTMLVVGLALVTLQVVASLRALEARENRRALQLRLDQLEEEGLTDGSLTLNPASLQSTGPARGGTPTVTPDPATARQAVIQRRRLAGAAHQLIEELRNQGLDLRAAPQSRHAADDPRLAALLTRGIYLLFLNLDLQHRLCDPTETGPGGSDQPWRALPDAWAELDRTSFGPALIRAHQALPRGEQLGTSQLPPLERLAVQTERTPAALLLLAYLTRYHPDAGYAERVLGLATRAFPADPTVHSRLANHHLVRAYRDGKDALWHIDAAVRHGTVATHLRPEVRGRAPTWPWHSSSVPEGRATGRSGPRSGCRALHPRARQARGLRAGAAGNRQRRAVQEAAGRAIRTRRSAEGVAGRLLAVVLKGLAHDRRRQCAAAPLLVGPGASRLLLHPRHRTSTAMVGGPPPARPGPHARGRAPPCSRRVPHRYRTPAQGHRPAGVDGRACGSCASTARRWICWSRSSRTSPAARRPCAVQGLPRRASDAGLVGRNASKIK